MQSLVKSTALVVFALFMNFSPLWALGSSTPGPVAKQSQLQTATESELTHTKQVATMQTSHFTHSNSSLHKHTKTHPAAIFLLIVAIAGVFLFPALLERCSPAMAARFMVASPK